MLPRYHFKRLAVWTMKRMSEARKAGLDFNEETVTESVLLKLHKRLHPRIRIVPYNKHEEGGRGGLEATGADWEFCFIGFGFYLPVRVQAKRLYSSGKYENLKRKGEPEKWENLRDSAIKNNAVPIYVFYNDDRFDFAHSHRWFHHYWGCSYSPITAIPEVNQPTPNEIEWMRPWHTLFDWRWRRWGDRWLPPFPRFPFNVGYALRYAYADRALKDENDAIVPEDFFTPREEPPEWVSRLQELGRDAEEGEGVEQDKKGDSEGYKSWFKEFLNGNELDGIAIIELVDEESELAPWR